MEYIGITCFDEMFYMVYYLLVVNLFAMISLFDNQVILHIWGD